MVISNSVIGQYNTYNINTDCHIDLIQYLLTFEFVEVDTMIYQSEEDAASGNIIFPRLINHCIDLNEGQYLLHYNAKFFQLIYIT